MAVFERNSTWYVDYRPEGKHGPRLRLKLGESITTRDQAKLVEKELLSSRGDNDPTDIMIGTTVRDLWPFYENHISTYKSAGTYDDVVAAGKNIVRILGIIPIASLTKEHLKIYIDARKNAISPTRKRPVGNRTINKELVWISGFLKFLRKEKTIDVPAIEISYLKYRRPIPIVLTIKEAVKLIMAAEPFYRCLFGFLYMCGCRIDEVRTLTWENLNPSNYTALVCGKGDKERIIPVPRVLFEWLDDFINGNERKGYIFISSRTGRPISRITKAINRAKRNASITKRVTPHLLRHSFSTHMMELNVSLRVLQEILGHTDIETTEWYTHVSAQQKKIASDTFAKAIAKFTNSTRVDKSGQR